MGAHVRLAAVQLDQDVISLFVLLVFLVVDIDVVKFGRTELVSLSTEEEIPSTLSDLSSHSLGLKSIAVFDLMLSPSKRAELDRFFGHGR